ncbi:endodeoxyribonuclease [Didymella sp. IMI 355093]|nr:endodeoxyribonuclease [Didymella sp. IMI 355093]
MEFEDVEDLLFGGAETNDDFENLWNDNYDDDEMLDAANILRDSDDDDLFDALGVNTADAWLLSGPPLTPADMHITPQHDALTILANDVAQHWVITRLEAMMETIVDGLLEGSDRLTFTLQSRTGISRRQPVAKDRAGSPPAPKVRQISFPGSTAQEAWNFTVLLRIIELVHGGLVDNTIMTKRDIYYKHPDLFVKQAVVDRCVDDIACTLGISRSQLNVTAAAKGLVAGCFTIYHDDGTQVNGLSDKEGMLVPKIGETDRLELTQLRWILIIEKEATFRALISTVQWEKLALNGLALTAKGYPDVASRSYLHQLTHHAPHVPIYAFMDLDPDGIAIMTTYKYGSYRLAHEEVKHMDAPALSLPNLRWLGVKSHHVNLAQASEDGIDTSATSGLQGMMRLTTRDRSKAMRMLEWDLCTETGPELEWRRELQTMLMLNTKAEIQILDELPGGVVSFLSSELEQGQGADVDVALDATGADDALLF